MARHKFDFSKQNPAMLRGGSHMAPPVALPKTVGRDKAIGQTVWIKQGPQKGLMGIVTDTTDTTARIEPHNGLKKISVKKELLGFRISAGQPLIGYTDFVNSKGWRSQAGLPSRDSSADSNRPVWAQAGNRTPVGNAGGMSSARTPAWAGSGSRTPAWSSGAGSATPAWAGSGSKTPAWAGSATPAWNSGSKTPAWSAAGNATPSWTGSKTPSWQAGNATPSWNTGAKTPSWSAPKANTSWQSQTPRASSYGQQLPRESWTVPSGGMPDYAPTPGVSRGWEDEWASTGKNDRYAESGNTASLPPPPAQTAVASGAGVAPDDAPFINPARMAQMQHVPSAYADAPTYLPPSP